MKSSMQTSIKMSCKAALLFVAAAIFQLGCSGTENSNLGVDNEECGFRIATMDEEYCRVSIYSLVSDGAKFHGKSIYTAGYLEVGPENSIGLAPSPDVFDSNDTISCVEIAGVEFVINGGVSNIEDEGVYPVHIAGRFESPLQNLCAGRIKGAVITQLGRKQ